MSRCQVLEKGKGRRQSPNTAELKAEHDPRQALPINGERMM